MHASFVVQRVTSDPPAYATAWIGTDPNWAVWEVELTEVVELSDMADNADAAVIASVEDSDVCEIVGLDAGVERWRWIFGETSDDDDALEDSLPERANETARRIADWAASATLSADRARLVEILSSGDVFAESGLFELLRHLGIAGNDFAEGRDIPAPPVHEAPGTATEAPPAYADERSAHVGFDAARLHHDGASHAWARFVDANALHDYGTPPAVLRRRAGAKVILASDPPVQTSAWGAAAPTVDGMTGNWLQVPEPVGGSIAEAAAWAREQFGPARIGPKPDRRPLRGEIDDEPPDRWLEANDDTWRYQIARPRHLRAMLMLTEEIGTAREDVTAWLADARARVIDGIAAAYQASGGQVVHDAASFPPPGAMGTGCVKWLRSGRLAVSSLVGAKWNRLLTDIEADRIAEVIVNVHVAERYANIPARLEWGYLELKVRLQRDEYEGEPRIELRVSEPLMRLVGSKSVVETLRRAATLLPVTSGSIRFSRALSFGPWVQLAATIGDTERLKRDGLAVQADPITNPAGALIWLQATDEPHQLTTDLAQRLSGTLGLDPVTFDR